MCELRLCNLFWTMHRHWWHCAFPFGKHIYYMDGNVYNNFIWPRQWERKGDRICVFSSCLGAAAAAAYTKLQNYTLVPNELRWKVNDLPGKVECQWIQRLNTKIKLKWFSKYEFIHSIQQFRVNFHFTNAIRSIFFIMHQNNAYILFFQNSLVKR